VGSGVIVCIKVRWPGLQLLKQIERIYIGSFDREDRVAFPLLAVGILLGKLRLIVASQPQVVGIAIWTALPAPADKVAYLAYLAVNEQQRSLGTGSALFHRVVTEAKTIGKDTLIWEVEVPDEADAHYVAVVNRSIAW
jgi:predicted N-acetyltransferase YhbS